MKSITLETARLVLRPFQSQDAVDLFELLSDRDTCYDDAGYPPFEAMNEEYQKLMDSFVGDKCRIIIALKENNKAIGIIHLMNTERDAVSYELGYLVNKNYRRKGYAFEALSALIDTLFADGVELLCATVFEYNEKSAALLKKLGFIQEGIIHKNIRHHEYGLLDSVAFYREAPVQQ